MIDLSICNYTYDTSASTWHTYLIQNVILTTIKYHRSKLITYKQYFTKDFGLYGAILNLMALFRSDSRHNDRVDSLPVYLLQGPVRGLIT